PPLSLHDALPITPESVARNSCASPALRDRNTNTDTTRPRIFRFPPHPQHIFWNNHRWDGTVYPLTVPKHGPCLKTIRETPESRHSRIPHRPTPAAIAVGSSAVAACWGWP